jgi:PadR family transcriptional regulator, regulatory protein AphA
MKVRRGIEPKPSLPENCSCSGLKLDRLLQPAILTILSSAHLNGYRIGKQLETMAMFRQRKPDASGMYRTLKELEHRGLIASTVVKSDDAEAKVYAITALGMDCLARWDQTLRNYQESMGELLEQCSRALRRTGTKK